FERVCLNARALEERLRRGAQRCGERERLASGRGECVDPLAHELFEGLGNRERLQRVDVLVQNPSQLQREERISARPLVNAQQSLACEWSAEPVPQEPREGAEGKRAYR